MTEDYARLNAGEMLYRPEGSPLERSKPPIRDLGWLGMLASAASMLGVLWVLAWLFEVIGG